MDVGPDSDGRGRRDDGAVDHSGEARRAPRWLLAPAGSWGDLRHEDWLDRRDPSVQLGATTDRNQDEGTGSSNIHLFCTMLMISADNDSR